MHFTARSDRMETRSLRGVGGKRAFGGDEWSMEVEATLAVVRQSGLVDG
jgi:hypothetical protein